MKPPDQKLLYDYEEIINALLDTLLDEKPLVSKGLYWPASSSERIKKAIADGILEGYAIGKN
jgi:hypothetical protein